MASLLLLLKLLHIYIHLPQFHFFRLSIYVLGILTQLVWYHSILCPSSGSLHVQYTLTTSVLAGTSFFTRLLIFPGNSVNSLFDSPSIKCCRIIAWSNLIVGGSWPLQIAHADASEKSPQSYPPTGFKITISKCLVTMALHALANLSGLSFLILHGCHH